MDVSNFPTLPYDSMKLISNDVIKLEEGRHEINVLPSIYSQQGKSIEPSRVKRLNITMTSNVRNSTQGTNFQVDKSTPTLHIAFDQYNKPKISLGRQAPSIKQLIFQGGGAKGIVYPSFLKELERKNPGFISRLDAVAGSSAGAMMALLLASGVSLDELENFLLNVNTVTLMWGNRTDATNSIQLNRDGIMSGLSLRQTLHEMSIKPVNDYYFEHIKENQTAKAFINVQYGGSSFLQRAKGGFNKGITFNDLKILHALNPDKFKHLHVTAYDKNNRETVYFDGDNKKTRNIPCFQAVGASLSIPYVFRSVKLKLENEERARTFIDGGIGSNAPVEMFKGRSEEKMLLHLDRSGKAHQILHDPGMPINECKGFRLRRSASKVFRVFKQMCTFIGSKGQLGVHVNVSDQQPQSQDLWYGVKPSRVEILVSGEEVKKNQRQDAEKIHNLGLNAVVVPHGDLAMLTFAASERTRLSALSAARQAASIYADNVMLGSRVQQLYIDLSQAISSLSKEEKELLLAGANARIADGERVLDKLLHASSVDTLRIDRQIERNRLEAEFYASLKINTEESFYRKGQ